MKRLIIAAAILTVTASAAIAANGSAQNITLKVKDAPISSVISALGAESGMNIVTSSAVKGKVTISLENVSPYDALMEVIKASGYAYKVTGNIIRIYKSADEDLEAMDEDMASSSIIATEKGIVTKTFSAANLDTEKAVQLLSNFSFPNTKVFTTENSNLIFVEGPTRAVKKIERIIKKLESSVKDAPQVLVEAQIMEITVGNALTADKTAIDLKYDGTGIKAHSKTGAFEYEPEPTAKYDEGNMPTLPGFYAKVMKGNLTSYIEAAQNKDGYNLLANPKVLAVSGKPAYIISGSQLGYKASTTSTSTSTTQTVGFMDVGTKLSFTPFVSSDGTIRMEIHPEVSEGSVTSDGLPTKQTTEATTTVVVKDGETIMIGGLIKNKSRETVSGLPILMDIPIIGNLFKKKELLWEKKEIVAMLTPHLVDLDTKRQFAAKAKEMKKKQEQNGIGQPPNTNWWIK